MKTTIICLLCSSLLALGLSIIPAKDKKIYCLDLMSGSTNWELKDNMYFSPKISTDGSVLRVQDVIPGRSAEVITDWFSLGNGRKIDIKNEGYNDVFAGSNLLSNELFSVDDWSALRRGYSICYDGYIRLTNSTSGEFISVTEIDAENIRFKDGLVYYVSHMTNKATFVKAYSIKLKKFIWHYRVGNVNQRALRSDLVSISLSSDGVLIDNGVKCVLLNSVNGEIIWERNYGQSHQKVIESPSYIYPSKEYFAIIGFNWIVLIKSSNGEVIWQRPVRFAIGSMPGALIHSGKIILALPYLGDKMPPLTRH